MLRSPMALECRGRANLELGSGVLPRILEAAALEMDLTGMERIFEGLMDLSRFRVALVAVADVLTAVVWIFVATTALMSAALGSPRSRVRRGSLWA